MFLSEPTERETVTAPIAFKNCGSRVYNVKTMLTCALFAWLISRIFSVNEQYFSLTTNQPIVLSAMAYQPNEQSIGLQKLVSKFVSPSRFYYANI